MYKNGIAITFESTHLTMKANKLLKNHFKSEVIPAPKELSKAGCKIAVFVSECSNAEKVTKILGQEEISYLKVMKL
jgi:hypothetical protein